MMERTIQKHGSKNQDPHRLIVACGKQIYSWVSNRDLEGQRNLYQNSMCHVGGQQSFKLPRNEKTTAADTDTVYTAQDSKCEINSILKVLHVFSHVLSNKGKRSQLCLEMSRENLPLVISGLLPCRASFRKTLDKMMCLRVFAIT